ncbi:MAG TPA: nitronate monooxygenase [Chondromyces sp.]|nr:nitronate monooxygenase [Chondromyces sp.]
MEEIDLTLDIPVWQAPMAGVTTPELVAAVSNAGALGNIGAGYLTAEKTRGFIHEVKERTDKPFGINVFCPESHHSSLEEIEKIHQVMRRFREELGVGDQLPELPRGSVFEEQIEVIIEEKLPVCSFTFGLPGRDVIHRLKGQGIKVVGTATTVREAIEAEKAEVDALVVQGSEAGGHRGSFIGEEKYIGLMSLLPQVTDQVTIPVIGAGGMMDARGILAALCLGAQAVQLGTAFLTTRESGAHRLHKQAILSASEEDVMFTKVFSGKTARGIQNRFIEEMKEYEGELPAYPIQNALTTNIRKAAGSQDKADFMSLWCGQSPRLSRDWTAQELIYQLKSEIESRWNQINTSGKIKGE